jgi:hypothetical protein
MGYSGGTCCTLEADNTVEAKLRICRQPFKPSNGTPYVRADGYFDRTPHSHEMNRAVCRVDWLLTFGTNHA